MKRLIAGVFLILLAFGILWGAAFVADKYSSYSKWWEFPLVITTAFGFIFSLDCWD